MAAQVDRQVGRDGSRWAGTVALVMGALCAIAVSFTYALSLSDTFNPPNWIRVVGLIWIPIAFGGVPVAYFGVARHGEGRARGRLGAAMTVVSLAALVGLVVALG